MSAGDAAFELIGGSLGNQLPLIENGDPVGDLAGDADSLANRIKLSDHIMPSNSRLATISSDERGEDMNRCGFASTVGTQQREDRSRSHVQVNTVEHSMVAE